MKRILSAVLLLALAVSATAWQKPKAPPFPGDGNPQHDGQPLVCINHSNGKYAKYAKNCSCRRMNPDGRTCTDERDMTSCSTTCRKPACLCANPCAT